MLSPGDAVSVRAPPFVHWGVVVGVDLDGDPVMAAASGLSGRVIVQSLRSFSRGRPVTSYGRLGELDADQVVDRALDAIGRAYDAAEFNCEHFVCYASGIPLRSNQVRRAVAAVAGLGWLYWMR